MDEVVFAGAVELVSKDQAATLAKEDRLAAFDAAKEGRCEDAEKSWFLSRKHRPGQKKYIEDNGPRVRYHLAGCFARRAQKEPEQAVVLLEKARQWDFRNPEYLAARAPVADALYAQGLQARKAQQWEEAYHAFHDTLRVDPQRPWARKYAEEARDHRLGLFERKAGGAGPGAQQPKLTPDDEELLPPGPDGGGGDGGG